MKMEEGRFLSKIISCSSFKRNARVKDVLANVHVMAIHLKIAHGSTWQLLYCLLVLSLWHKMIFNENYTPISFIFGSSLLRKISMNIFYELNNNASIRVIMIALNVWMNHGRSYIFFISPKVKSYLTSTLKM